MRKIYATVLHCNLFFGILLLVFCANGAFGQVPQYFKSGGLTGGNTIPLNQASQKTQLLYTPTDFSTLPISGYITKIYFRNSAAASTGTFTDFQVSYIQNTDLSFPSTSYYTGLTTVLSAASITINGNAVAGGWFSIDIPASTMLYDNSKTLIIQIQYTARVGGLSTTTSTSVGNKRCSGQVLTATTGTTNTIWNDFGIDLVPAGPCTNPPVPGTVTSSASNVCLGVPFSLSATGGTSGTGQIYQWQSSPDNITFTNIPGANSASLTTSQTTSTYYQLVVTCGVSVNSNSVLVTSPAAVSGTFTINSALATGGTNFQTFNDAYDYIKCGIVGPVIFNVNAASGPYNEQLIMSPVPGASATNTVTFNGNGRTISFPATVTTERAVIKLNGADHIHFNNLSIQALSNLDAEYGFGVQLLNDADSNSVNNCNVSINLAPVSTNYAGIVVSSSATSATTLGDALCDGNIFRGNTITGGYYGITVVGSTAQANQNNQVINNNITDFFQQGIYLGGNFNTQVDSNRISRPNRATNNIFYGIYVTSLNANLNITRNTISNPFGGDPTSTAAFHGIYFTAVDALSTVENKVSNNLIYNLTGNGDVYGIHNIGSDNTWYFHNTISIDGTGGTGISRGFYQTTQAAGIRFENNIISVTRGGASAKYAIYYNVIASDIISDRNDLYINSPTGNAFTGFFTTAQATLADWRTASGDDLNSLATNPLFTSALTGNFKPTNASIDNLGLPVGVLNDILGVTRSLTTPDAGAYEFTPGPCTSPATAGASIVSLSPVCVNTSVQLALIGNSTGLGQTYQWQTALASGGPYTTIGNVLTNPDTTIVSSTTLWYRAAVTCSGNTVFSDPILLTVNPALPAGTYTINAGGLPGPTNFISFNAAKAAMLCGIAGPVVFNVVTGSGPYNEQLVLDSIAGTSSTNTITFNGNGNTIAFSSSFTAERAVIKLRSTDHVTFDSLIINADGAGTYGFGVQLINNADSNTINNCTILANTTATTTNFAGIVMNSSDNSAVLAGNTLCDGNTFSNNTINGGYYGITMVGSNTVSVAENRITNNTINDFYQYGIYLSGNFNSLVESNSISRPTRAIVTAFYGVYVTQLNVSVSVSKNRISNPYGGSIASTTAFYGVYFTGVDALAGFENIVSNNLIYNINGDDAQYGLYNLGSDNVLYYHNTISLEDAASSSASLSYGFYQTTEAAGLDLKNNIFAINRAGGGNKFGLFFNTATSTFTSNTNDFYLQGANSVVGYNGTNRITLADWQTATGQDGQSVETNPLFVSPGTGDFHPFSAVLDNRGTPGTGITTDIENVVRSVTTPDIGAYEFTVPPCTSPPVAGTATANPSINICVGAPVALSVLGNSFGSGQTFQWEFSTTLAGPWSPLGGPRLFADTVILASSTLYYRVAITCSGNTVFSTPVLVTLNPAFLAGDYTINNLLPASATNFTSFTTAVAALECGITGPVNFYVKQNPIPYTEQVRMHNVGGTSSSVRVSFINDPSNATPAILNFDALDATRNYVLKLDSASYITYRGLTITALNLTNGRVVEIANTASFDSIVNCNINASVTTSTVNTSAGIYADLLKGTSNVIRGNTITNGSSGIYWEGTVITNLSYDHVIDSNTINNSFNYGIFIGFNGRINVNKNIVNITSNTNPTSYGIYSANSDSAFRYTGNRVNITGTFNTIYGMYFSASTGSNAQRGLITNNTILGLTGNTGVLYGLYQNGSEYCSFINNVISINTSGVTSYGSYSTGGGANRYYNNTVVSSATSTTNNVAAYFAQTSGALASVNIRNNIFSHLGGGRAMYVTNLNFIYTDYNTFYTSGATLIQWNAANLYPTLQAWRDTSYWDLNSIAYQPALISPADPRPDIASPDVWAIHGRGVQIVGNDFDFNNAPRPTTLTTGVPDMGAYEFLPTSLPTVLTAVPPAPAPGITQTFMYGTDTVTKITYSPTAPVPASISLRRYSGVLPPGLVAGQLSMYYYTDIDVPAQGAYDYSIQQFYIDPWQGFIPTEPAIKLGRTDAAAAWLVNAGSTVDTYANVYADSNLTYIDKFTGLTDGTVPPPPVVTYPVDSSNKGTRFWVAYGHHYDFNTNAMDMVLYLSTETAANVEVSIHGTNYKKIYAIPANSVRVSLVIPKYGLVDARITDEGLFDRGIRITSDVPIVAYAHIYNGSNSGAGMLLPVGVYGYEYQSLNSKQYYPTGGAGSYSWFFVIADRDSTLVEITPTVLTKGGRPAGVPFQVYLNTGELYNVMGTINGGNGTDLSGSTIKSVANASGKCYPIGVFSGSSRTAICNTTNGDNMIQQVFPSQAWGRRYLTFATANSLSPTNYNSNIFRVLVKDPATVVKRNGVVLSGLVVPGNYYEFSTTQGDGPNGSIYVEADKPVMVAQFMVSTGANSCPGVTATGSGDPEMIYISPIEQGIKKAVFYSTDEDAITSNYINVVIPNGGIPSLTIDAATVFTNVFPHPSLPGYTCIRHDLGAAAAQHIIQSDSAFTAITYGLGSVESYGYNAGTLVKNLRGVGSIRNILGTATSNPYTCAGAPFQFSISLPVRPTQLEWLLSGVANLTPNTDVIQVNPVPTDSIFANGDSTYIYTLPTNYVFSLPGTYNIPVLISHPTVEGCNNKLETTISVVVIAAPIANFTTNFTGCIGTPVQFNGIGTTSNGVGIFSWDWEFGDTGIDSIQNPIHNYTAVGTYNVHLSIVALDGCVADTIRPITIDTVGFVAVVEDSLFVCTDSSAVFAVANPLPGSTYTWYTTQTGGAPVFTGPVFTVNNITSTVVYWVQASAGGTCISDRVRVTAILLSGAIVDVVQDSVVVCSDSTAVFAVNNPQPGINYDWYTTATGGVSVFTGPVFTVPNVTSTINYWVEASSAGGCISARTLVTASVFSVLPVTVVDDSLLVCSNSSGTFEVNNPQPGVIYNWYPTATGGTSVFTGTTFTVNNITSTLIYFVEASVGAGCASVRTQVTASVVSALTVAVVEDSLVVCRDSSATFAVSNPQPGVTYNWFTTQTGGTPVFTGPVFTVNNITSTIEYWVEASAGGGCASVRVSVTATILAGLPLPVVAVDSIGVDRIKFSWNAVTGAISYQVSTDGGTNWIDPSSGPSGLTHTVTGLPPLTDVTLIVRAFGSGSCLQSISLPVTEKTKGNEIYIPNSFTPNGDGLNDVFLVYGTVIRDIRFVVFNQWGEKIFESTNQANGWNGIYKGKKQPSGVYMYVMQATLRDNTPVTRKGAINLIR